MNSAHVNWPSDAAHQSLCEAWTHYSATWRIKYRMDLNFRGTKLSRFSRFDSHPRKFSPAKI